MKTIKILLFITFLFIFNSTNASNINEITVKDNKNVDFTLSNDVILSEGFISSDIKFLKDIEVIFTSKDFDDQNKLILNLALDLEVNKTYSLLTILGPEANMDFSTSDSLENFEIISNKQVIGEEQGLNRILIKDSKTIELFFNSVINENEFEFKLLNELKIENISSAGNNIFSIELNDKLDELSNYLVMVLSLKNNFGNEISLDEDLYELKTTDVLAEPGTQEEVQVEEVMEEEAIIEEEEPEIDELSLENVALNSAETPDTGPETTVLLLLTFIINSVIFFKKKVL